MKIKIKKLHPDAIIPQYQTPGAAAVDLHSVEDIFISPMLRRTVKTGIAVEIPPGWCGIIRPRSGLALAGISPCISSNLIDSDYRGEIGVLLCFFEQLFRESTPFRIRKGERIAQLMVERAERIEWELVESLSETSRGTGGFGSTGQ